MKIFYLKHDARRFRVWPEGWAHDQFEVIDKDEFAIFRDFAESLNLCTFVEQEND